MKKPQPLSREFLLNRGFCCNNGCTNCPYKMTPQLHDTLIGRKLIEGTLPDIAKQLERIADALESKQPDQTRTAFENFINNYPNDEDLGKKIREIWQK